MRRCPRPRPRTVSAAGMTEPSRLRRGWLAEGVDGHDGQVCEKPPSALSRTAEGRGLQVLLVAGQAGVAEAPAPRARTTAPRHGEQSDGFPAHGLPADLVALGDQIHIVHRPP